MHGRHCTLKCKYMISFSPYSICRCVYTYMCMCMYVYRTYSLSFCYRSQDRQISKPPKIQRPGNRCSQFSALMYETVQNTDLLFGRSRKIGMSMQGKVRKLWNTQTMQKYHWYNIFFTYRPHILFPQASHPFLLPCFLCLALCALCFPQWFI